MFDLSYVCLEGEVTFYHYGWKDCATILFYFFIAIILHAVVQEYLLDVSILSVWHNACKYTLIICFNSLYLNCMLVCAPISHFCILS